MPCICAMNQNIYNRPKFDERIMHEHFALKCLKSATQIHTILRICSHQMVDWYISLPFFLLIVS